MQEGARAPSAPRPFAPLLPEAREEGVYVNRVSVLDAGLYDIQTSRCPVAYYFSFVLHRHGS